MSPFGTALFYRQSLGGDERDRTDDPLLAKQVLSQLSYIPILVGSPGSFPRSPFRTPKIKQRLSFNPADLEVAPKSYTP